MESWPARQQQQKADGSVNYKSKNTDDLHLILFTVINGEILKYRLRNWTYSKYDHMLYKIQNGGYGSHLS